MRYSLGEMINVRTLSSEGTLGRLARFPLKLVPRGMVIPIPLGRLRGKRWIVGSAIHRCWMGLYEYDKQQVIAREVRPGSVFYDVGANVGFYSLLASSLVGKGRVFAFEPVPRNLDYLRRHLVLNRVENVEVLELAVSDRKSTATFQIEQTGFRGHLSAQGGISVSTVTLDYLVKEGRILPPDYIKMDIEGAELLALRGTRETFERYRPVLFLATHGREVHRECCQLLESWGYECRSLQEAGDLGDLDEVIARFSDSSRSPALSALPDASEIPNARSEEYGSNETGAEVSHPAEENRGRAACGK
jgi:FkbM family methyltransferase